MNRPPGGAHKYFLDAKVHGPSAFLGGEIFRARAGLKGAEHRVCWSLPYAAASSNAGAVRPALVRSKEKGDCVAAAALGMKIRRT